MEEAEIIDVKCAKRFVEEDEESVAILDAKSITPEAAEILATAKPRYNRLYLRGLTEISDEVAKFLGNSAAQTLILRGLRELSDVAAAHLASHRAVETYERSHLYLEGLQSLSPEAAYHLGTHVGRCDLTGLKSLPDEVVESLAKGIRKSERREQDYVNLKTYENINLSEFAALTLSEVLGFVLLNEDNGKKVVKALKAYAQAEASLKPKETAEVRDILSWSECPTEIREALEKLDKMGANEADWLKVMLSKNTLLRLMKVNPENIKYLSSYEIQERQPIWQALAEYLGKYPKTLELFKDEALGYFKHGDFASDLGNELTPELAPILSYGTRQNGIEYSKPEISEEKAALFSTLACPIRFSSMPRLRPETIRALAGHRALKNFQGVTELDSESAEALCHCVGHIWFEPGYDYDRMEQAPFMKLSDESALILAKGRFDLLSLYIQPISEQAAKALAGNPRINVYFPSE
jgi:hypothetical protein